MLDWQGAARLRLALQVTGGSGRPLGVDVESGSRGRTQEVSFTLPSTPRLG
jgi:hypothetical protein